MNWHERALRVRKECPELGWGTAEVLEVSDPALFILRHDWLGRTMVTIHNLSSREVEVSLPESQLSEEELVDVFADSDYSAWKADEPSFNLEPYGYRWLRAPDTDSTLTMP